MRLKCCMATLEIALDELLRERAERALHGAAERARAMPKKQRADATIEGTLEDYFAAHHGSGQVSTHLLIGTPTHDALASEPLAVEEPPVDSTPAAPTLIDEKDAPVVKDSDDAVKVGAAKEQPKAEDTSVAGLSLSDYMHVAPVDEESASVKKTEAKQTKPKVIKAPVVVPGMSLDSYLGVSNDSSDDSDGHSSDGDEERKKGRQNGKAGKKLTKSGKDKSTEDGATPFQRREKKKQRLKNKLQQPQQQQLHQPMIGGPISKTISVANDPLPSPTANIVTVRDKGKRRKSKVAPHGSQQSSPSQSPLPKLAMSPSAAHIHASMAVADHWPPTAHLSSSHHSCNSTSDITSTDKLPPL